MTIKKITIDTPLIKTNDSCAALSIALNDLGFIYIKSYMIEAEIKKKTLIEILPEYMKTQIPIYIYYRQQPYADPKIKAFIDFFN